MFNALKLSVVVTVEVLAKILTDVIVEILVEILAAEVLIKLAGGMELV